MKGKSGKRKGNGDPSDSSQEEQARERQLKGFKGFNIVAGIIHLVQGILMLVLASDFSLPVTRGFLEFDPVTTVLYPASVTVFDLRLGPLIASFLLMSAVAHLLIGTVLYKSYTAQLRKGMNAYRWHEYAISASVMIVAISMLVGIYDLGTLLLIFFMNAMMIAWGYMMEKHNQFTKRTDWTPFILGCVAGLIPWVVIAVHLWGAGAGEGGPPTFVYVIFISIGIAFNSFAVNQVLQYKKVGKWRDYLYGERVYIILSLVAKTLLAWQVFAGTLRPE